MESEIPLEFGQHGKGWRTPAEYFLVELTPRGEHYTMPLRVTEWEESGLAIWLCRIIYHGHEQTEQSIDGAANRAALLQQKCLAATLKSCKHCYDRNSKNSVIWKFFQITDMTKFTLLPPEKIWVPLAIGFGLLLTIKEFFEFRHIVSNSSVSLTSTQHEANQYPSDITEQTDQIVSKALFGTAQEAVVELPVIEDLPETTLQLELEGVAVSNAPGQSSAMITSPDNGIRNYHEGDALPGGANLREIFSDKVILDRAGMLETLYFPITYSAAGGTANSLQNRDIAISAPSSTDPQPRTNGRSPRETEQQRDARLSVQLQQNRNNENQLSLEERLAQLRSDPSQ